MTAHVRHLTSHISCLPPELLAEIQTHSLPLHSSLSAQTEVYFEALQNHSIHSLGRLRLVCRLWDAVAVSTPNLWRIVTCHESEGRSAEVAFNMFQTYLQRSASVPIWVSIDLRDTFVDPRQSDASENQFPTDEITQRVHTLLVQHHSRIEAFSWAGRGKPLWQLDSTWDAIKCLAINFHFSRHLSVPFDPAPNLLSLRVEAADLGHATPLESFANLPLQHLRAVELSMCSRSTIVVILSRCPNVSSLHIAALMSDRQLGIPRLPHLKELAFESEMDWLPYVAAPHADILVHLRVIGQLIDLPVWLPFPTLPALRTLEAWWDDAPEPLITILLATPGLHELYLRPTPSTKRVEPIFSFLLGDIKMVLQPKDQWENWGPSETKMVLPRLRLLRLRLEQDGVVSLARHETSARFARSILMARCSLHVEILLPKNPTGDLENIDELERVYAIGAESVQDRMLIRLVDDLYLPEIPLAGTYIPEAEENAK